MCLVVIQPYWYPFHRPQTPPGRRHQCLTILIIVDTDVINICRTAGCITTRETRIYPCHRPQHWCVHRLDRWQSWSSRLCGNHVYMCIVSSPPHLHMWVNSIAGDNVDQFLYVVDPFMIVSRLVSIVSLIVWHSAAVPLLLVLIDKSSYPSNIPTRTVFHCPSEVTPNVSEVLLLLASMDDDDNRLPVLLVQVARFMW